MVISIYASAETVLRKEGRKFMIDNENQRMMLAKHAVGLDNKKSYKRHIGAAIDSNGG